MNISLKRTMFSFALVAAGIASIAGCASPERTMSDQSFVADVRPLLSEEGLGGQKDADLVQMAKDTCKQLEGGATADEVMVPVRVADTTVLEAEIGVVIGAAKIYYCPAQK
ncbi:DUF732 domain-containing protein [Arthrobacter russicus]|uniref:DUF732 domain-containing protein n=1 Tax=Arthrobacter russicus TaxID=172040 RepID=UPI003CED1801